jgi:hypothetical protein
LPADPPALDANALFTLAQRPPLTTTLAVWLLAPSCMLDGVVALVSVVAPGSSYATQSIGASLAFSTRFVLFSVMAVGFLGVLYGMSSEGPRRILAGPERLSLGPEGAADPQTSIAWPKVTAIIAVTRRDGRVTGYRVEAAGAGPLVSDTISWLRDPRSVISAPSPRPLLQRSTRIAPDELAALVVARTGLALEQREA